MERPEFILKELEWFRGGSREICDPPPTDTDEDFFVMSRFATQDEHLRTLGFTKSGDEEYPDMGDTYFNAYRKGDINVIILRDYKKFSAIKLATKICKGLNLTNKNDRIFVHEQTMEGYDG